MWYLIVSIPDLCNLITLNLSITIGVVSTKIYDKRDDFNIEIVNFPILDGDVSRSPSYGVYVLRKVGIDTILEWLCAK